ncbi:MAG: hypothetical protein R2824_30405 [Saprospiraceae bacterium]
MKSQYSLFLLLLFLGNTALAQTGHISGTVRTSDGEAAAYVNIFQKAPPREPPPMKTGSLNSPGSKQVVIP